MEMFLKLDESAEAVAVEPLLRVEEGSTEGAWITFGKPDVKVAGLLLAKDVWDAVLLFVLELVKSKDVGNQLEVLETSELEGSKVEVGNCSILSAEVTEDEDWEELWTSDKELLELIEADVAEVDSTDEDVASGVCKEIDWLKILLVVELVEASEELLGAELVEASEELLGVEVVEASEALLEDDGVEELVEAT